MRLVPPADPRPEDLPHVCPWCAAKFATKGERLQHWLDNPVCNRNRNVSNQTQSKYNDRPPDDEG